MPSSITQNKADLDERGESTLLNSHEKDNIDNDEEVQVEMLDINKTTKKDEKGAFVGSDGSVRCEIRAILKLAIPAALNQFLGMMMGLVDLLFLGHLGADALAGCGLANVIFYACGLLCVGFACAMDTLCSQAFGAGNKSMYSLGTQRTIITMTVLSVLFIPILWNAEQLSIALKQDPEIARLAGRYLRVVSPSGFFYLQTQTLTKFLACQNIMRPPVFVAIAANVLNAFLNYVLIIGIGGFGGYGFDGAPIATLISRMFSCILLFAIVIGFKLHRGMWVGWRREAFSWRGMVTYIKIGVPGMVMLSLDSFFFVICGILSGVLGKLQLAVNESLFNMCALAYMVPLGIGIAASVRVGNLLGSGDGAASRVAARVASVMAVIYSSVLVLAMFVNRNRVGYIYTNDEDVIAKIGELMPYVALFHTFDTEGAACGGVIRGMGRQTLGALGNASMWIIGLPLSIGLAFGAKMGLEGMWTGIVVAIFCSGAASVFIVHSYANWDVEVERARKKVESESGKDEQAEETPGEIELTEAI